MSIEINLIATGKGCILIVKTFDFDFSDFLYRLLESETGTSLTFDRVQLSDAGDYYCVAHNAFVHPASVTSSTAILSVNGNDQQL